jgi:hypothetical protein
MVLCITVLHIYRLCYFVLYEIIRIAFLVLSVYYENYTMHYFITSQWIVLFYIIVLFVFRLCYFALLHRLSVDFVTLHCCVTCLWIMLLCIKLYRPDWTMWSRAGLHFEDVGGSTSSPMVKVTAI